MDKNVRIILPELTRH